MERTFNMGIGMIALLAPGSVERAQELLNARGVQTWVCGEVRQARDADVSDAAAKGGAGGSVNVVGNYALS